MRFLAVSVAVTAVALILGACGASNSSLATATGSFNMSSRVPFSECMRSHGVPDFPDPGAVEPSGNSAQGSVFGILLPATIRLGSPAFRSAFNACRKLVDGGHSPPKVSDAQKRAFLRFAQCMRTHGVPDYPDPVFRS